MRCNLIQMYFQCLLVRVCMYACVNVGHWFLFSVSNVETIDVMALLHCHRRTRGFLSCTEIGGRDVSLSLCNANMLCIG